MDMQSYLYFYKNESFGYVIEKAGHVQTRSDDVLYQHLQAPVEPPRFAATKHQALIEKSGQNLIFQRTLDLEVIK
jgi:hypothetical protein